MAFINSPGVYILRAVRSVARFVAFILSVIVPEPFRLALDGPTMERTTRGVPLSRSLQHSMRHESRVSRRSSDRHI